MPFSATVQVDDPLEYDRKRRALSRRIDGFGYGTRATISRALGVSPATISSVLNGRIIDARRLQEIAEWARLK